MTIHNLGFSNYSNNKLYNNIYYLNQYLNCKRDYAPNYAFCPNKAQLITTNDSREACNWTEIGSPIYNTSYMKSQTVKLWQCLRINFSVIRLIINSIT